MKQNLGTVDYTNNNRKRRTNPTNVAHMVVVNGSCNVSKESKSWDHIQHGSGLFVLSGWIAWILSPEVKPRNQDERNKEEAKRP